MATPVLPGAGELNARIQILPWADVPNATLGTDAQYGAGIGRWAKHESVHSLTMRAGAQTNETPTDLFTIRAGTGTRPQDIAAERVIEWKQCRYRVLDAIGLGSPVQFTQISTKLLGRID